VKEATKAAETHNTAKLNNAGGAGIDPDNAISR
jgi:hypothetical protein